MSFLRRLWFLLRRPRLEGQLQEEIRWHLEQRADALVADGMDEAEARAAARRMFGNLTRTRERSRDVWGFVWLDLLARDVRHAARALVRNPLLSATAVVSLGCAMAACCAVFALAHTTLLASLPVPDPHRLVVLKWVAGAEAPCESLDGWSYGDEHESHSTSFSYDAYLAARGRLPGRADVLAFASLYRVNVTVHGESAIATGQAVSGNYFGALGLRPAAGRFVGPSDDRDDAREAAAVISHAFWLRRFGGRPDAVGATMLVNRVPTVIVGVAPAGFNGTGQVGDTADVSVPIALHDRFVREGGFGPGQTADDSMAYRDPRYWWVNMMARLAPGVDVRGVQPGIEQAIRATVVAAKPAAARQPFRVELEPGARGMTEMRDELVPTMALMAAIVLLVVVIACANLATLLLARSVSRDREVGVRVALGASRGALVRATLVESLMIGGAGGGVGLLGARWLASALLPALRLEPAALDLATSAPTLAFAGAASVIASLLFGLIPAWRGADVRSMRAVRDGTGSVAARLPRLRTARAILAFQVALSIVVLVAAGLLVRTVRNLERVSPGFDTHDVLLFRVDPTLNHYDTAHVRRLYADLLARLRSLPGVQSASFSHHALLSRSSSSSMVHVVDGAALRDALQVSRLIVDGAFFRTMRIPLLAGTTFDGRERPSEIRPVVINRTFALRAFHSPAPLGRRFRFSTRANQPTYEIIGVAADIPLVDLRRPIPPTVYFSGLVEDAHQVTFAVRSAEPPAALAAAVRHVMSQIDSGVPIDRMLTQDEQIAMGVGRERLFASLATGLGALALLLACVGIYGVVSYAVSRRTTEIGVRLALGARPVRILVMVVGEAARVLAIGAGLGLAAACVISRYLESLLFGLAARDLLTQACAVALIVAVTVAAALLPARRAARIDPLVALRNE